MEEKLKQYIELLSIDIKDHYNSTLWKEHALKKFYEIFGLDPIVGQSLPSEDTGGLVGEALNIALDGWRRCFLAYGKEVLNESPCDAEENLDNDPDWLKVQDIISNKTG